MDSGHIEPIESKIVQQLTTAFYETIRGKGIISVDYTESGFEFLFSDRKFRVKIEQVKSKQQKTNE